MRFVCRIDREIYSCVTEDIATDEVIITEERIQHIRERHPDDYEKYAGYMADMLEHPAYIIEDADLNTAFVLKEYPLDETRFRLILRIQTSADPSGRQNSVLTFQYIKEKEYRRLIKNKKVLYKAPEA